MDFDFGELDPTALGLAVFGGLASLVVSASASVGLIYKIGGFFLSTIVCYIVAVKILNK